MVNRWTVDVLRWNYQSMQTLEQKRMVSLNIDIDDRQMMQRIVLHRTRPITYLFQGSDKRWREISGHIADLVLVSQGDTWQRDPLVLHQVIRAARPGVPASLAIEGALVPLGISPKCADLSIHIFVSKVKVDVPNIFRSTFVSFKMDVVFICEMVDHSRLPAVI